MQSQAEPADILITGGAGFIGRHLLALLLEDASVGTLHIADRNPPALSGPRIRHVPVDLCHPVTQPLPPSIKTCIHLAALAREPGFERHEYFDNNYAGTRHLVQWLENSAVDNLVYVSTAMAFKAGDQRHGENDLPDADTAYGISKLLGEEVVRGWCHAGAGRRLRIVRPGVVFGHGGGGNFARLHKALQRHLFFFIGRDSTVKSAIYVKDMVRLLRFLVDDRAPYEVYHGAYPEQMTIRRVCDAFCEAFGWQRRVLTVPYRLAMLGALSFMALNAVGLRNPIHYRLIQKLHESTDLAADRLAAAGFQLQWSLPEALRDWSRDCGGGRLY